MRCWKCFAGGAALSVALLVCQTRSLAADRPSDQVAPGKQQLQQMERGNVTFRYLIYLPKDYEQRKSCPLLLFLHGEGERGDNMDLVKRHGPPKLIGKGKDFPFMVVSPQCPKDKQWEPSELVVFLDEIVGRYKVDQDRIYLSGLSMGGYGTWDLAAYAPDRFAALVPISGSSDPRTAKRIAHIPTWVFHCAKDQWTSVEYSQKMVDALKENGSNVKFTVYTRAGHDAWSKAYSNPQLYEWLLQQKRPPKTPEGAKR